MSLLHGLATLNVGSRTRARTTKRRPSVTLFAVCALDLLCQQALAHTTDEIAQIEARIERLEAQLARIESRTEPNLKAVQEIREERLAAPISSKQPPQSRQQPVRVSADIRYRLDTIDDAAEPLRHHHRIRARASALAQWTESTAVGFGLSTGGSSNDSGNQTLGDGFSIKPVGLDLAYFDWSISKHLNLVGGKMTNPLFRPGRHHLLYDDDLRPEGLALSIDTGRIFGSASVFWAEERAEESDSLWMGIQLGYRGQPADGLTYTAGAGFYEITNTQGRPPLFTPLGGQGNQLDAHGNYLYGFSQAELFGELQIDVHGHPVTLFLDYVTNTAAERHADGIALGLGYRRFSQRNRWSASYVYQDLEANAVVGAFTDSDFGGGTSDGRGHVFNVGYTSASAWDIALRYIVGKRGEAVNMPRTYKRLQADLRLIY